VLCRGGKKICLLRESYGTVCWHDQCCLLRESYGTIYNIADMISVSVLYMRQSPCSDSIYSCPFSSWLGNYYVAYRMALFPNSCVTAVGQGIRVCISAPYRRLNKRKQFSYDCINPICQHMLTCFAQYGEIFFFFLERGRGGGRRSGEQYFHIRTYGFFLPETVLQVLSRCWVSASCCACNNEWVQ
jgi:hypothetical protein